MVRSSIGRAESLAQQDELPPIPAKKQERKHTKEALTKLVRQSAVSSALSPPAVSLDHGRWVKLICGASFEDVVDIRNLSLVYTLAGAMLPDPRDDAAAYKGVTAAQFFARHLDPSGMLILERPWIMVSINDDEDPHFRKAEFDAELCPADCPRPCERVCPAAAISFDTSVREERLRSSSEAGTSHLSQLSEHQSGFIGIPGASEACVRVMCVRPKGGNPLYREYKEGVIIERCYGCGRCLPVCPLGLIRAKTYVRELEAVAMLIKASEVDAIEIHTSAGHLEAFDKVVKDLSDVLQCLRLIAVSVPDLGDSMLPTLNTIYKSLRPSLNGLNLWQLDGRPMSGDIGVGATKAAVALASKVAAWEDRPPGYLQLAGGTNAHTLDALKTRELFLALHENKAVIAGVAYGGYARKIVTKYFQEMESCHEKWNATNSAMACSSPLGIEHYPSLLLGALQEATDLIGPSKVRARRSNMNEYSF